MKVKEAIEKLKEYDPEFEIGWIDYYDHYTNNDVEYHGIVGFIERDDYVGKIIIVLE